MGFERGKPHKRAKPSDYTEEQHRIAFEAWYESGSYQEAARAIGKNPALALTVRNWSKPDYRCTWHCAWHGWDQIKAEREQATTNQLAPIVAAKTRDLLGANMDDDHPLSKQEVLNKLIRSDLERVAHYELVWTKLFFKLTGVMLPCPAIIGEDGKKIGEEQLQKILGTKGANLHSFESGVRALCALGTQINALVDSAGLRKGVAKSELDEEGNGKLGMDIDGIRKMRKLMMDWANTSPDERAVIMQRLESEQRILDVQNSQCSEQREHTEDPETT